MPKIISEDAISRRNLWVKKIHTISGLFSANSELIHNDLQVELNTTGVNGLLDHLRLCGNIPESYEHDTSEEKQYSKYTDSLLSFAYKSMGLQSHVITGRADVADVEGFGKEFSFVADAKAFRLSRTAKNQKDFKVQAMDGWKHGKPYAMVVCPIYQLPTRTSQIYQQAITRDVCIFTYSHLSLMVRYANEVSRDRAEDLLLEIFKIISCLNPTQKAFEYWLAVNKTILNHSSTIVELWKDEKIAATESIEIAKAEGLRYLASERENIMRMTHDEALKELFKRSKIESKIKIIQKISDNGLFGIK